MALRLQVLSTEHWSLLASRSLAWNESFTRAGMYLSTLSAAMVALALVAQASGFGNVFVLFALVILPVVLFVGMVTFMRLGAANYHDAQCVAGMNRIRGAYLELAPDLAPYLVMSAHDDVRGLGITMGLDPRTRPLVHQLSSTPMLVAVLNSILIGVIAGLLVAQLGATGAPPLLAGATGFVVGISGHAWRGRQVMTRAQASLRPLFPSPPSTHG